MYYVTCDGFPLLDLRDDDFILCDPKVRLEVNTVCDGSFTIYRNHPNYDKIKKLKSVIEVSDETSVIFRGRATGDSIDFDNGMSVDLEGVMAYFNDSIVRPFSFPGDFTENDDYISASESGNVIKFFISWLIDNHNSQVQDFQKFKLGNVTVTDPNNYITRSNSNYASTWDTLKAKLFDSSLGGYLCIRYESDGNYIDYLSDFSETNTQEITFGENLLDLTRETELSSVYSAVIPLGTADITIEGQPDKDLNDDLVKVGDTIFSRKAVDEYGWIYAPTSETTWDDVTDDSNLVKKAAEWLANGGVIPLNGIEATAVDLHFTDQQIESLRIYKNVFVHSEPHGLTEQFQLTKLEIELLNPQNTKITVGKTFETLTDRTSIIDDDMVDKWSKISKTADEIKMEVIDRVNNLESTVTQTTSEIRQEIKDSEKNLESTFSQTTEEISASVQDIEGKLGQTLRIGADGVTITNADGQAVTIDGGQIDASKIKAEDIDASKINAAELDASQIRADLLDASQINASQLDASQINASQLDASQIHAENLDASKIKAEDLNLTGAISWGDFSSDAKTNIESTAEEKATETTNAATASLETKISSAQERADSAYSQASTANTNANSAITKANSAVSTANSASSTANSAASTLASLMKSGTTYIDGSKIYSNSIYADSLHLGGDLTVYSTSTGSTIGGYLGYTSSANDGSAGIHMQKGSGEVVVTASGAKMTYSGTTNQIYISNGGAGICVGGTQTLYTTPSNIQTKVTLLSTNKSTLGDSTHLWGQIYSNSSTISQSDANSKNSIEILPGKYVEMFDRLVPRRYKFNDGTSDRYHTGFVAQEVESAMQVAGVDSQEFGGFIKDVNEETGEDIYFLRYEEFIGILVAKIKQLEERISELSDIIES